MAAIGVEFERPASLAQQRRLSQQFKKNSWSAAPSDTIYAGIAASLSDDRPTAVAIAFRDTTYLLDFIEESLEPKSGVYPGTVLTEFIITHLRNYAEKHLEKIIGIAMSTDMADKCPVLCSRLWAELDILPLVLPETSMKDHFKPRERSSPEPIKAQGVDGKSLDEQAESMSRKCVRLFGPENIPLLQVGFRGIVEVDSDFHVQLTTLDDFKKTVTPKTWSAVEHYAKDLKNRKKKIAFFSATPQGGGVALMRHALVRFSYSLGTDIRWYVPKPRPGVFQITKKTHNILQGVASPGERLTTDNKQMLQDWINDNAKRYWTCPGGPLCSPSQGGADVIIIDDPQMPGLIPIAKYEAPDRPILFRSHIQIRSDLIDDHGTPQAEAWGYLWNHIKLADCFISHPVSAFVPSDVPEDIIGYMPASTDWLDGLNKNMCDWDVAHYGRIFNAACKNSEMPVIEYPDDQYIVQIARFDPSKGIFDAIDAYEKFHSKLTKARPDLTPPKLLICGHGSVDDPDGAMIYDEVIDHIDHKLSHNIRHLICVMRLRPSDQVLNALLSKATIALQLSTREGFEVKVSEALHKGKPVIATRAGGIPLQIENNKTGFLVNIGDTDAVAQHLYDLWTIEPLYRRMADCALNNVCDEVSTVGNALVWLSLASKSTKGETLKPSGRWLIDLAFEELGMPALGDAPHLTRAVEVKNMG